MVCESLWVGRTQKEWEMGQLCYLGASNEETKPKIGIYAQKNEQDRLYWKIFTFGQKVNGQLSKRST